MTIIVTGVLGKMEETDLGGGAEVEDALGGEMVPGEGTIPGIPDVIPDLAVTLATQGNPGVALEVEADGEGVDLEVGSSKTVPEPFLLTSSLSLIQMKMQPSNSAIISNAWQNFMARIQLSQRFPLYLPKEEPKRGSHRTVWMLTKCPLLTDGSELFERSL